MKSVPRENTKPEVQLRKVLHAMGFRYRLHDKKLPGSPDLVFPKYGVVIFIHGCFWHRHGCKYSTTPGDNKSFWKEKFKANEARDEKQRSELEKLGWRVYVVWECELKQSNNEALFERLQRFITVSDGETKK